MEEEKWIEYYKNTKNNPPSKLLIKALDYVKQKNVAIDIGAGALKDSYYLLENGFDVVAIDKSEIMAKEIENIKSEKFHYYTTYFVDFDFGIDKYNIASAMYSLPFNNSENFNFVINKIKKSLKKDGIFCGQLFGINDAWSKDNDMTFHDKEKATKLFDDMEIILFEEEERDGKTADGNPKHWHIFNFIVRKI